MAVQRCQIFKSYFIGHNFYSKSFIFDTFNILWDPLHLTPQNCQTCFQINFIWHDNDAKLFTDQSYLTRHRCQTCSGSSIKKNENDAKLFSRTTFDTTMMPNLPPDKFFLTWYWCQTCLQIYYIWHDKVAKPVSRSIMFNTKQMSNLFPVHWIWHAKVAKLVSCSIFDTSKMLLYSFFDISQLRNWIPALIIWHNHDAKRICRFIKFDMTKL